MSLSKLTRTFLCIAIVAWASGLEQRSSISWSLPEHGARTYPHPFRCSPMATVIPSIQEIFPSR